MKTNRFLTLFGAVLALVMLATACGGGDGDDQAVIDAVVANIRSDGDVPEEVDVECMASSMVKSLGGATAMEDNYGLTVEAIANDSIDDLELPKAEARSMADGMMGCGLVEIMAGEMAADGGMSAEDSSCLVDNMDQDAFRDTFAAEFMNDADADEVGEAAEEAMFGSLFTAIGECDIDPSSLGF